MPRYRLTTFQIPTTLTLMVQRDESDNINLVSLPLDLPLEDVAELLNQALIITRNLIEESQEATPEESDGESSDVLQEQTVIPG